MNNMNKLKACPFCGSSNLEYSTKAKPNGRKRQYHATIYCKDCRAYGPRVLSQNITDSEYIKRTDMRNDDKLEEATIEAWNTRRKTE